MSGKRYVPALCVGVAALCIAIGVLIGWSVRPQPHAPDTDAATLSSADIEFAQHMSVHHQQAITMVDMLGPQPAPDIGAVAEQIRVGQWREIGTLTGWLEVSGAPMQQAAGGAHTGHHGEHPPMHGMASNAELTRLQQATGTERDLLFVQLMIRHHQGGIEMAAGAIDTTDHSAVRTRALSMVKSQQQEISMLLVSLDHRGGTALPYP